MLIISINSETHAFILYHQFNQVCEIEFIMLYAVKIGSIFLHLKHLYHFLETKIVPKLLSVVNDFYGEIFSVHVSLRNQTRENSPKWDTRENKNGWHIRQDFDVSERSSLSLVLWATKQKGIIYNNTHIRTILKLRAILILEWKTCLRLLSGNIKIIPITINFIVNEFKGVFYSVADIALVSKRDETRKSFWDGTRNEKTFSRDARSASVN